MHFVSFMDWEWPREAPAMFTTAVTDVQAYRAWMLEREAAAEMRLPIVVPNPAHSQFIPRQVSDPVEETRALSANRARQLLTLPQGMGVLAVRDRAILRFYLYSGARIATGCQLKVSDFHVEGTEATVTITEKGGRRRKIGLHFAAAQAITEYLVQTAIKSGPLFRPRTSLRAWVRLILRPLPWALL